ncbi:MAG: NADH-quinone oxidoreductase subunit D [Archaeoglobaceae archaeon]|nr:NADH-quinone oxidoreductase subunit D [Archaeoglobaceae archaeon]MCX8151934.1 NADH-quinone oxidoreductase subunit D [Archaeoglobaceae archaeon]MDW8013323.1 NADH-quinone oxidoreductase subunit D [Archaeoglobaceae archaeon]
MEYEIKVPVQPPTELQSLFIPIPPEYVEEVYRSEDFLVLVGPQHPGSGHMRLIVRVHGDIIREVIPDPGYVHRCVEKIAENRLYIQNIPLVERPSIMDALNFNLGYVRAIEDALEVEVPKRAKYIRTMLAEICRIGTHLYDAAILAVFLGHTTGFMYPFGIRELICEVLVRITGARFTSSFIIPGGVRRDVDEQTLKFVYETTFAIEKRLKSFERIFIKNPTVIARLKDVGVLTKEEAIKFGVVGPFLRASGVEYDVRKVEPYEAYGELDWDIPVADAGDSYSRFLVRVNEISQSLKIVRQCIKNMPEEKLKDFRGTFFDEFADIVLPQGEFTTLTEASRGTLIYSIVSDGESNVPYRMRMITPGWLYLRGFMESLKGERLADLQAIYGSFGYFPPEADR